MTQILTAKHDKRDAINSIVRILDTHIMMGLQPHEADAVREHVAWLRRQTADLNVNCKLETVPELRLTRIVLELSFSPIPSLRKNGQ